MRPENSSPIRLHLHDWPEMIDGEMMTLEQHGALIKMVLWMWQQQEDLTEVEARRLARIHALAAPRFNLPALIDMARSLSQQRAIIDKRARAYVASKSDGLCHYCGEALGEKFHVDHATPIARGGRNRLDNYRASCPSCNMAKGVMTEAEFKALRGVS